MNFDIYNDIALRTGGDIYIGVVGPVRTGKSTFIKRFMESLVLERIDDEGKKARTIDELPQSADGKTIMTTEPKFVPNEAIRLKMGNTFANIRLIDCVGYLVEGALGHIEGDKPRLVRTPWSETDMPFQQAAEMGTDKVIKEHSTIGIVVTTDGTITDINRAKYLEAEERVVKELKTIGKPFIVVLNSRTPQAADTVKLGESLFERYGVPVVPLDVMQAGKDELTEVMLKILMEFPIKAIDINLPKWMRALGRDHKIISDIISKLLEDANRYSRMRDYDNLSGLFADSEIIEDNPDIEVDSAKGTILLNYKARDGVFYKVLANECNTDIDDDYKLMSYVVKASRAYRDYEKIRVAMQEVKETGYGVVIPTMEEIQLEEPEIVRKGSLFGVKLKASAPSLHLVRVDVDAEISPVIGSEQQSEELLKTMLSEFENNKQSIWNTNMFGKPLNMLMCDDIGNKIANMPKDAQKKLKKTITRIVNENRGGVLCILL
ncbi:MAG: stage IV sporulation protein A [Clostridia bacterium]|nr:stage IV sporulation protein A [Clostridia bacterium]